MSLFPELKPVCTEGAKFVSSHGPRLGMVKYKYQFRGYRAGSVLTMLVLALLLCVCNIAVSRGADSDCGVTWDVGERWGISFLGLCEALEEARSLLFIEQFCVCAWLLGCRDLSCRMKILLLT